MPVPTSSNRAAEQANVTLSTPPEIADLLGRVDQFLDEGQPGKALDLIVRARLQSPWGTNAQGVCQLRLGNAGVAVNLFRGLVLAAGGIVLHTDVPAVFKTNYATALLAAHNLGGCLSVLADLKDDDHPAAGRLRAAVQRWKDGLTLWQRIRFHLGSQPDHPPVLDVPPGDLQ
jgi:hypothetical protein